MSRADDEDDDNEVFHDSLERIASATNTPSVCSDIDDDEEGEVEETGVDGSDPDRFSVPEFPMGVSVYDVWLAEPFSSIEERRCRLLSQMRLGPDPVADDQVRARSKVDSATDGVGDDPIDPFAFSDSNCEFVNRNNFGSGGALSKPPNGKSCKHLEATVEEEEEGVCRIKNLDNGKEFLVNGIREDGMWNELKEVGTGKQMTMEEFEMSAGHSPIVQELMRRQNVEEGKKDDDVEENGSGGRVNRRRSWLKSLRGVTSSVGGGGNKERRSSDERDGSSGRRSSSATDDSQDVSFNGPERVRVRQYGKSCKELSAMYKCQEIRAHNGSIWSIKFSLDGKYLASAGEDCVIHVWQVVPSEKKGDLLTDDAIANLLFFANGSPEISSVSPIVDSPMEKKRRSRSSFSRKSVSMDHIYVPETSFSLSNRPVCSFDGHTDDVLDLSWSKSQHLLSSSMDKTVRLWHLSNQSCLKVFSHNDYVTCIQFNPVDESYFISGSLDAKLRIWSIPDHRVVDWADLREMVTAACYTPNGQGALVGTYKGGCRLYSTTDNKLLQRSQINLQNKKKKSHKKKITGFQFTPGSQSEVLVTSADCRVRVIDGITLAHKFKGFQNTQSQISASITANGKYVISASEDSNVYVWRHEADSRPTRSRTVTSTQSYEHFDCPDVSVAVPWPGMEDSWGLNDFQDPKLLNNLLYLASPGSNTPRPVQRSMDDENATSAAGYSDCPISHKRSATVDSPANAEKSASMTARWSRHWSTDLSTNGAFQNQSAWGMVIITGGLTGELRTFQNFGLPVRL